MAALITFWSSEPAGLKEVPGPTLITAPEQFAEKKQIHKSKEIKRVLVFIFITKLSYIYTFLLFLLFCIPSFITKAKRQVSKSKNKNNEEKSHEEKSPLRFEIKTSSVWRLYRSREGKYSV
jgi:hypothetical protein